MNEITNNVANEDMAALADLDLKALYDDEGNLIANPTQEDYEKYSQDAVDVNNTVH